MRSSTVDGSVSGVTRLPRRVAALLLVLPMLLGLGGGEPVAVRFPIDVDLALGADPFADPSTWSWTTDITSYAYVREGGASGKCGRLNEQSIAGPSWCELLLNNRDGRFTRLNPTGPYYGQLRRNTPVRVRINPGGGFVTWFTGLVSEWPVSWDPSGSDFWVRVRADGIMRLLGQGRVTASALTRTVTGRNITAPVAYWPMEESAGGTSFSSGLPAGPSLRRVLSTSAVFSSDGGAAGSLPLPDFSDGGTYEAAFPVSATTGALTADFVARFGPGSGSTATMYPARWTTGSYFWYFALDASADTASVLIALTSDNIDIPVTASLSPADDDEWHHWRVTAVQNGSDIDVTLYRDGVSVDTGTTLNATLASPSAARVNHPSLSAAGTAYLSVGHFGLYDYVAADHSGALDGYADELAGARFTRLLAQHGLTADVVGTDVTPMGPQPPGTLLDLLRECETASQGVMGERRTGELGLDLPSVRENAAAALALDYAQSHVAEPFGPTDDDLDTRNDITAVSTSTGFSAPATDEGSIAEIGRYDDQVLVNVPDEGVRHVAGRRLNIGTGAARDYRWPSLTLKLHSSALASLRDTVAAVTPGSRVTIDNLPANLPPDLVDLVVEGYRWRFDNYIFEITFNCAPYRPYGVFLLAAASGDTAAFLGRLVPDTCYSVDAHDSDDTGWLVFTDPYWTRVADDFPCLVRVGGEDTTLTAAASSGTDLFFRTTASGWGTADSGQAWTVVPGAGGSAADFATTTTPFGHATITPAGLASDYKAVLAIGGNDRDVSMELLLGSLPASGVLRIGVIARYEDTSNYVHAELRVATTGLMELRIVQRVAGVATTLLTMGMGGSVLAVDTKWTIRVKAVGTAVKARAWLTSGTEPHWWATATTAVATGTSAGAFCRNESASAAHVFSFDTLDVREPANWTLTRSVNGVSKSHSALAEIEVANPMVLAL